MNSWKFWNEKDARIFKDIAKSLKEVLDSALQDMAKSPNEVLECYFHCTFFQAYLQIFFVMIYTFQDSGRKSTESF